MLGTMRTGPDLANVGTRYSAEWHLNHTFNPRAVNAWSIMPSFAFLYSREKVVAGQKSEKALELGREWTVDPGYRWRPTAEEWERILAEQGPAIGEAFSGSTASPYDLTTPEGKSRLLDFWLTTEEQDYQIVPTEDGEALTAYLLSLRKAETPLPEAKE
jgi:cytochrome c oxidase cbb3-type subunit 2